MSEPPDPPTHTTGITASISADADVHADVIVTPFRVRLVEACEAALGRLDAKAGPGNNIFAEAGEVLFWVYALSQYGFRGPKLLPEFKWARDQFGHGLLAREPHYTDYSAAPEHFWRAFPTTRGNRKGRDAYNNILAGQSVVTTLRAEFNRVVVLTGWTNPPT